MNAVFESYPKGGGEMLLALCLADHAHADGTHVFPSVETMARYTRQSVRAVQYQLRKMEDVGWLILVRKARGGRESAGRPAEYRINPAWLNAALKGAEVAPNPEGEKDEKFAPNDAVDNSLKGAKTAPNRSGKGCKPRRKRVQNGALKGAKLLHPNQTLTIKEPSAAATRASGGVDNHAAAADEKKTEKPKPDREAAICELLAELSGRPCTPDNLERVHVLAWIGDGLTDAELRDAYRRAVKARERKNDDRPVYVAFLAPFVREVLAARPAAAGAEREWWLGGEMQVCNEGNRLGVRPKKPDEALAAYRVLVAKAAGKGPWIDFVLKDAQRSNSEQFMRFVVATLGEALMPVDWYAS